MSVIESVKEGLKAAAIALSVVVLVALAYFVAVRLPVTFDAINRAVNNANNLIENAVPVVNKCEQIIGDLADKENKDSLRGNIDGIIAHIKELVGDTKEAMGKGVIKLIFKGTNPAKAEHGSSSPRN